MKKILFFLTAIVVAVVSIVVSKPYVDAYKEKQKYEFSVNTSDGEIKLSNFKGKTVAVYFGYMYCPDVCPTSLSMLGEGLKGLSEEELEGFQGIFISVDPDRDTLKNLKEYALYFHPNFLGATSDEKNILDITTRYGTFFQKEELKGSEMGYSVSHTSYIYIFDKEGNLSAQLKHFLKPSDITKALKKAL